MSIQDLPCSIVGKIAEKCVDPILHQFQYLFCYKCNIQTLRDGINELEQQKAEVQRLVDAARNNGEEIKTLVTDWLKKVDDLKSEANALFAGTDRMYCFNVRLPNLKSRYLDGRGAAKGTNVVQKLIASGKFDTVGYISSPGKMPYSESDESISQGLTTQMSVKKEVMEALKQDKTRLVAICGMGGVGKTTLVKQIADQVKNEKLFDDVAMAIVSQNPDVINVQNQLAGQLGLTISEQTDRERAERLYTRLSSSGKRILVILDDIWKELNFRSLGIPARGEGKSLKIILTSRFPQICKSMGAEIVEVNPLPEDEAWHLFEKVAEISEDSQLSNVAKEVANEFQGLPLAIVVVAKALKNKTLNSWTLALRELKKYTMRSISGVQDSVFSIIERSYNYLESVEAKSLLLLCSLFPEDYSIPIECLVRYVTGLQLFKDRETLDDIRGRVDILIDELKSCYLLLNDEKEDCVKLHVVVRDVCLSIASKGQHVFLVRNDGLEEWRPHPDLFIACTAISQTLASSDGPFPFDMECPRLKLLRLVCQSGQANLLNNSFAGMNDLRVVEFRLPKLEFSPAWSGQMFTTLRTLCLNYCELGTGTSSMLASLPQLEILSFFKSILNDRFPTELAELRKLKLLDLRFERSLQPLPCGILSSLKRLEEVYVGYHHHLQEKEEERACLKEVTTLSRVKCLQIHIYDFNLLLWFLQEFHVERLSRFYIVGADSVITMRDCDGDYQFRRTLELHLSLTQTSNLLLRPAMTSIFKRSENLSLCDVRSSAFQNVLTDLDKDGFVNLKRLQMLGGDYKSLIDSTTNLVAPHVFENLVSLKLFGTSLHEICCGNLPPRCFSQLEEVHISFSTIAYLWKGPVEPPSLCNLRNIEIRSCSSISTIFSQSTVRCLEKLQSLTIKKCSNLKSIVMREESMNQKVLELPQLKFLELEDVDSLINAESKDGAGGAFFNQVSLPRLELLNLIGCWNQVKQLVGDKMPNGSLENLKSIVVQRCADMELLFDFEGLNVPTLSEKGPEILPRLESLKLQGVGLAHIGRNFPKGIRVFQNLKKLHVCSCPCLPCLFDPPRVATMFSSLEELLISDCSIMHEVICGEDDVFRQEDDHDVGKHGELTVRERTVKEFVFPKLKCLSFDNLDNLERFSGLHWEGCEFKFPSLIQLEINGCPKLKKLFSGKLDAPKLKQVKTNDDKIPEDLKGRKIISFTELDLWREENAHRAFLWRIKRF